MIKSFCPRTLFKLLFESYGEVAILSDAMDMGVAMYRVCNYECVFIRSRQAERKDTYFFKK